MTNEQIREIFLANGFTVKEGQADLKPYVYAAARALINATLEEAAKLCDEMQSVPASEPRHCAEDIRSLKT